MCLPSRNDQHLLRSSDGVSAVSNDKAGNRQRADVRANFLFAMHVQVTGSLIQHQKLGLPIHRPRQDYSLLLPTRQA